MHTSDEKRQKKIRIGAALIAVAMLAAIAYSVATLIYRHGKVAVKLEYAPFAARISMADGQSLRNHATNYLPPGEYTITVSYDNFESIEETMIVSEKTTLFFGHLTPENDEGYAYMSAHQNDFMVVEGYSGTRSVEEGEAQRERWPITSSLPIHAPHYTISHTMPDSEHCNIVVETSSNYLSLALTRVRELLDVENTTQNLERYGITIKEYESPYDIGSFQENSSNDPETFLGKGFAGTVDSFSVIGMEEGEYYYGFLRRLDGNVSEISRFVLIRSEESWRLAAAPYPFLVTANTPDVPVEILQKADLL